MMAHRILRGKRLWTLLGCCTLFLWGSYWAYQNKTVGFSVPKITSEFAYNPALAIEEPVEQELEQLQAIFVQKFTFLAAGSQSYAFVSEDGKWVIKFFRMKHLIPRISDLWNKGRVAYQKQNLLSIFSAHKLAYDEMREDAGLVYIHLNKSDHLQTHLKAVDSLGRTHTIDLDGTEFVVQNYAELIFTHLRKLISRGDSAGVRQAVAATLDLVRRRLSHGIADHDKAVKHNYGFVGDRPIHLDVGRIYKAHKPKDYDRIAARIDQWLKINRADL